MPGRGLLLLLLLAGAVGADDVVRRDGTRTTGTLTFHEGQFRLDKEAFANVERVRFPAKAPTLEVLLLHRVHLVTGEAFVAELVRLDAKHLHAKTAWGLLAVPRTGVERVTHVGGQPLVHETFTGDLTAWQVTGLLKPVRGTLAFTTDGQQLERTLAKPLATGTLHMDTAGNVTKTRRGVLELEFVKEGQAQAVAVEWCGPGEHCRVTTALKPDFAPKVARPNDGRFGVEWDRQTLSVFVGEQVLWSGPTAGELRRVRVLATGLGDEPATLKSVLLREATVNAARPWADLTRDAVRSTSGDELFGTLTASTVQGVTLTTKPGERVQPWPTVSEIAFQRGAYTAKATTGEHVQLRVRSVGSERDIVRGIVTAFDAKTLTLTHPLLGELTIPRTALEEVQSLFFGTRHPLTTAPFHLGQRLAFGYATPKPDGTTLAKTLTLESVPDQLLLVIEAAQVAPQGPVIDVFVNGQRVDTLNRHVDRRTSSTRSIRVPIPAKFLQRGDNTIELRWQATKDQNVGLDGRAMHGEWWQNR